MTSQERSIVTPIVYYNLLDRPLTLVEIYKYQAREGDLPKISLAKLKEQLKCSPCLINLILEENGIYSLADQPKIREIRNSRLKTAQLKWKKVKKLIPYFTLIPFARLVAATGSLTAYNTTLASDFDILLTTKSNRLWLTRIFSILITGLLGKRRHGKLTQDRLCLNCFIEEDKAKIKNEAKPHNWHSAQEYTRLTPLLEIKKNDYQNFIKQNQWLADFFSIYPWPNNQTANKIEPSRLLNKIRGFAEWLFAGSVGDWLERKCHHWQESRIIEKSQKQKNPSDQIYAGQGALMLHPQSKNQQLIIDFTLKMQQLTNNTYATNQHQN